MCFVFFGLLIYIEKKQTELLLLNLYRMPCTKCMDRMVFICNNLILLLLAFTRIKKKKEKNFNIFTSYLEIGADFCRKNRNS